LEKNLIDREGLLDAISYQKQINKPLRSLALEKKFIKDADLETLDAELRQSDKNFVELALSKQFLTPAQVEELNQLSSQRWTFLGEALVERDHLSLVQLNQAIHDYREEQGERLDEAKEKKFPDIPQSDVVSAFLDVTLDLFLHYTKKIIQVESVEKDDTCNVESDYMFVQKVKGERDFLYGLSLPNELVLILAESIFESPQNEVSDLVLDALSEFVNIVVGNGCVKINLDNVSVSPEPPRVLSGALHGEDLPAGCVTAKLKTTLGEFKIAFFYLEDFSS
jgi:CheY-specific phosphatase CheX